MTHVELDEDVVSRHEPQPPARRRHPRLRLILALGLMAFVVAVALGFRRWNDRGPSPASVDEARERFRSSQTAVPPASRESPREGVYVFSGAGTEHLSFLDTAQEQGPTFPGTVTATSPGCWDLEIEYNSFHSQGHHFCSTGGVLVERGGVTDQKFDFAAFTRSEHSEFVCDPPSILYDPATATPGRHWPVACRTTSQTTKTTMTSTGATQFVGQERIEVGGVLVNTNHVRQELAFTGDQTGSQVEDMWFASDGLPVRDKRSIRVVSPAPKPIGSVTYTEEGTWVLTSLTPQR